MSWYQSPHSLKVHCPSPFKAFPSNWKGKGGKIHVMTNDENEKLYSIFIDNLPLAHMWPFQIKIFCHMHIINHLCHSLWSRASTSYGHLVAMVNCYHLMVFFWGSQMKLWFKLHLTFTPKGSIISSFVKSKA